MDKFLEWNPLQGTPRRLFCEGLYDDHAGFRLILKGEEETSRPFQIAFESVLAYRNMDEGDRIRSIQSLPKDRLSPLFIVENSSWVRWFHQESCDIHRDRDVKHYAIYTSNDCIDVISVDVPCVTWCADVRPP